jgi:hypothetical protein
MKEIRTYPDPTTALPLPPRPDLEHYRTRAKDLVKACKSGNPDAIRLWAGQWLDALAGRSRDPARQREIAAQADEVATFARARLSPSGTSSASCRLADAQFVIARAHGFPSWPVFVTHLESLARSDSPVTAFEAAADAIVAGDETTLERLLRERPELTRARSTRAHHGTCCTTCRRTAWKATG